MQQPITGYRKDDKGDWVAELFCRHFQHVRHNPPWTNRPWVESENNRKKMLGCKLNCVKCIENSPPDY